MGRDRGLRGYLYMRREELKGMYELEYKKRKGL